ncbi:MAG: hypothetical protein L3J67_05305 [Hyphomicrobiaceae bacterium]|nr:hypothetical protein [Hyphomicrobiaceae bacterium]
MKLFSLLLTAHLMALSMGMAQAGTLAGQECEALREQRKELASKGVGRSLEKGAQWAAQNLDESQLIEVGDFLQLMEKIRFRCKGTKRDKKSKFSLLGNVPLPVRNSRRVQKAKEAAKQDIVAKQNRVAKKNGIDGATVETKAVISAITKNADNKAGGAAGQMRKSIQN